MTVLDVATELRSVVDQLKLKLELQEAFSGAPRAGEEWQQGDQCGSFIESSDFQSDGLDVQSTGSVTYDDGSVYKGDVLAGHVRHGQGELRSADGSRYHGGWSYNQRSGSGTLLLASGLKYVGQWREDRASGRGCCWYPNGNHYEGEWAVDLRHGWGLLTCSSGDVYEGEWSHDQPHGHGRWQFADGSVFEGRYQLGERAGGRLVSADGLQEYEGGFLGPQMHGEGVLLVKGHSEYRGAFREGLRHGHGRCTYADGSTYEGAWRRGVRHGQGRLACASGYAYDGAWRDDKPHGQGAALLDDGSRYSGEFVAGERHGHGICSFPSGDRYQGGWLADKRHGYGICSYASRDRYRGEWQRGKRHGHGTCIFADGVRFSGRWEDDAWVQSAADPVLSRVAGKGLARAVAGQHAQLTIEARDSQGQRRLSGGDVFCVTICPATSASGGQDDAAARSTAALVPLPAAAPAGLAAAVQDKGDGTYQVIYRCTLAGRHQLHITSPDGMPVAESPYPLLVLPGVPHVRSSTVEGPGRCCASCDELAEFRVQVRDRFGNFCSSGQLEQLPVQVRVDCQPDAAGGYKCSYRPPAAGRYVLEVTSGGRQLKGSPFAVQAFVSRSEMRELERADEALQGPAGQDDLAEGPIDQSSRWARAAQDMYGADGDLAGWDSEGEGEQEGSEEQFIKAHPHVPVVERLQDLWKLGKLLKERKRRQQQARPSAAPQASGVQQQGQAEPAASAVNSKPQETRQTADKAGEDAAPTEDQAQVESPEIRQPAQHQDEQQGAIHAAEPKAAATAGAAAVADASACGACWEQGSTQECNSPAVSRRGSDTVDVQSLLFQLD